MTDESRFVEIESAGRLLRIEHQWIARERGDAPLIVFLHEGLGSVSMWKDFPQLACDAAGCRGLVYSRPGYGRSTPRAPDEAWAIDFMHRQAYDVLPTVLRVLDVDTVTDRPWLFGHSDGGSIALLHAARFTDQVAGAIVMAPHIRVEEFGLVSIRAAREAYRHGTLRAGLARHHDDPDSAFKGWNDIWLAPAFPAWNIEAELANIRCPLLAIQGEDDPYGTMAQIDGIRACAPQAELVKLPSCGHSPHRDQAQAVIATASRFIQLHPSWT